MFCFVFHPPGPRQNRSVSVLCVIDAHLFQTVLVVQRIYFDIIFLRNPDGRNHSATSQFTQAIPVPGRTQETAEMIQERHRVGIVRHAHGGFNSPVWRYQSQSAPAENNGLQRTE